MQEISTVGPTLEYQSENQINAKFDSLMDFIYTKRNGASLVFALVEILSGYRHIYTKP